jgi:hypothetical protein
VLEEIANTGENGLKLTKWGVDITEKIVEINFTKHQTQYKKKTPNYFRAINVRGRKSIMTGFILHI